MAEYFPIRELTPYNKNWTLKARVVSRSDLRTFAGRSSNGAPPTPGQVFSADIVDREGGEIHCSFFGNAASTFDGVLKKGAVYTFKGGKTKIANKAYNTCKHDYEINFDEMCQISPCDDDMAIGMELSASYIDLKVVKGKPLPSTVDIVGVVAKKYETSEITAGPQSKNPGMKFQRAAIELCDETENRINITFFGDMVRYVLNFLSDNVMYVYVLFLNL